MKFGNIRYLVIATVLTPALGGVALLGCDDEDPSVVTKDGGPLLDGGGLTDGPAPSDSGGDTLPPIVGACTTTDTPINAEITVDTVWNCPSYLLKRIVYVRNNSTLTIMPGTVILSDTGVKPSPGIVVSRGSKLIAKGTKEKPIVFSSGNAPGARSPGDFAGVALMGSARLNSGEKCVGGVAPCAAPAYWERFIEGLPNDERHTYGGNDDANSCGELSYVRIEFAGTVLSDNKELNGLTMAGCGSGTKVSYLQVHRGKDDGVEIFGGTANIDHILVTGDEDDGLDWDFGWRGNAQFIIIHKWNAAPKTGNPNAFEGDNHTGVEISTPVSAPKISNVTLIGTTGAWGMTLRSGTRGTIRNVIQQDFSVMTLNVGYTLVPAIEWPALLSIENSFFWNNGPYVDATVAAPLTSDDLGFDEKMALEDPARKNKFDVNPGITSVVESAPNYTPTNAALNGNGQAIPPAGMIDPTATYAGAVAPNMPSWTEGWTKFPAN